MKKKIIGMLCGAMVVSMAVPAFAEVTMTGYLRDQGYVQNTTDTGLDMFTHDTSDETFVVQRLRAKVTNKVNDLVSVVWFGEIDTDWGTAGGALGADGVNVETKNLYMDVKPTATFPLSFRVGVQGLADTIQNIYLNNDAAALVATGQFDAVGVTAGWSKYTEGALADQDDTDLYFVQSSFKASDALKLGLDFYFTDAQNTDAANDSVKTYTVDVNAAATVAGLGIDGFVAYQFGKDYGADEKIAALAASANVTAKLDPATVALRVIYYGADKKDDKDASFNGDNGGLSYMGEGLNIFLADALKSNNANDRAAIAVAAEGYGLLGVVAKAKVDFAPAFAKVAIGYFQALTDKTDDDPATEREGKALGTEIAAEVGTKIAEAATLSLRGSYALLGSFYDDSAAGEDPDNAYMAALMLNVAF
jgi:hypothetical protein